MPRPKLAATFLALAACADGNTQGQRERSDASSEGHEAALDAGSAHGDAGAPRADDGGQAGPDGGSVAADAAQAQSVAAVFDGLSGYVEIPDDDAFSEPTHGGLTVEAWLRPDSLAMPMREDTGYVHWLGKGEPGQHEWVARMYQQGNDEGRENRISFYAFNLGGGLGAGSYVQEDVTPGAWIHYVGELDDTTTTLFKNGEQKDSDPLSDYAITPMNGTAPVRIGTRDFGSYFEGAITRVAIYAGKLDAARIRVHAEAIGQSAYDELVLAEPTLLAFYKLDETTGTIAHDAKGQRHGVYHGGVSLGAATFAR